MEESQTRRGFFVTACRGVSLAALGGALVSVLESCGGSSSGPTSGNSITALPQLTATPGNGGVVVTVGADSPLAGTGNAALVRVPSGGLLLVARTSATTFTALSAICTHQACTITGRAGSAYFCPCHGSEFDTSGRVLVGPAVVPLQQYQTQWNGVSSTLTITA